MSYLVFARKYRPQAFDEIVGQEFITTTLKNAIQSGRIAHAYLFSGPRGIGKTSTARIFAKSLNCKNGPTASPCQKCPACSEISSGSSLDVIEIDGASNRGIDEIRNLRENVKFGAIHGKFKIYIIDEVHMLTQEAFNALLKTLEEPPAHIKFIFATTQPHKLPSTIMSRCQKFDFRRIPINQIIGKLKEIAAAEKLGVTEEAFLHIARASEGCLRDAETILDQLGSFCKEKIEKSDVSDALGMIEVDALFAAMDCVAGRKAAEALTLIDGLVNEGKDLSQFISNLMEHVRNLLVMRISKDLKGLIDMPPETVERVAAQSGRFSVEDLLYIIYLLMNTQGAMKRSDSPRIPLEAAFIKLTARESIVPLNEILDKITELEKRSETGVINHVLRNRTAAPADFKKSENPAKPAQEPESAPSAQAAAAEEKTVPESAAATLDENKTNEIWLNLIKLVRAKKISAASYLMEGQMQTNDNGVFVIGFPSNFVFYKESLERPENRALIESSLKEIIKKEARVKFTMLNHFKEYKTPAAGEAFPPPHSEKITEPIVQSAIQIFKGRVV